MEGEYPELRGSRGTIEIKSNPFTIGRDASSNYVIANTVISRQHCVFEKRENNWVLRDTSTNGSYVNEIFVNGNYSEPLKNNDVIKFSDDFVYIFHLQETEIITDEQLCSIAGMLESIHNAIPSVDDLEESVIITACPENLNKRKISVIDLTSEDEAPSTSHHNVESTNRPLEFKKVKVDNTTVLQPEELSTISEKAENSNDPQFDEELICAICSELFVKATTLNCSHTFCEYCINLWKKNKNACPVCRVKIKSQVHTLVLDNLIDTIIQKSSEEVKVQRKEVIEDRSKVKKPKRKAVQLQEQSSSPSPSPSPSTEDDDASFLSHETDEEWEDDYLNDDWYDAYDRRPYYGGYGACYVCGRRGHWANGCPLR